MSILKCRYFKIIIYNKHNCQYSEQLMRVLATSTVLLFRKHHAGVASCLQPANILGEFTVMRPGKVAP